jgi:hypothetical protein
MRKSIGYGAYGDEPTSGVEAAKKQAEEQKKATAVINSIGNVITGIPISISGGKTLRTQWRDQRRVAIISSPQYGGRRVKVDPTTIHAAQVRSCQAKTAQLKNSFKKVENWVSRIDKGEKIYAYNAHVMFLPLKEAVGYKPPETSDVLKGVSHPEGYGNFARTRAKPSLLTLERAKAEAERYKEQIKSNEQTCQHLINNPPAVAKVHKPIPKTPEVIKLEKELATTRGQHSKCEREATKQCHESQAGQVGQIINAIADPCAGRAIYACQSFATKLQKLEKDLVEAKKRAEQKPKSKLPALLLAATLGGFIVFFMMK